MGIEGGAPYKFLLLLSSADQKRSVLKSFERLLCLLSNIWLKGKKMNNRQVKILGTGKYVPEKTLLSADMDKALSLMPGTVEKKSGIIKRHVIDASLGETVVDIACKAALAAVRNAGLSLNQIDCLVFAGGTGDRLVPCTAALIHHQLGLDICNIPAFDINSTCVGFLVAFDLMGYPIELGKYRHVLIVSADTPSLIMNPADMNTYIIFGDGAAAAVIGRSETGSQSAILRSLMKTYSVGAPLCAVSLGVGHIPRNAEDYKWEDYTFHMDGRGVYKLVGEKMPAFLAELLSPLHKRLSDIDVIVPHQASNIAMQSFQDVLGPFAHRLVNIYPEYGNQVAASIPTALHEAIVQKKLTRGATVLLIGTSAGVSLSGMVIRY